MNKTFTLLSLLLLGTMAAKGQNFTVSGHLKGGVGAENQPFTNVALLRVADSAFVRGATTDAAGCYAIRDVSAGEYLLRVAAFGFEPYWQRVAIVSDTILPTITLTTSATMLEGVQITAERPLFSIDGEKMLYATEEDPTVQSGTAIDALRSAPDVEVDAAGNISMRGASGVEVWLNGRPSHMSGETLKQYLKSLPASAIKRIEVITNPSARYSTSNGVINLVTNASVQRNDFLSMTLNGNSQPNLAPWFTYVHGSEKLIVNAYLGPEFWGERSRTQSSYTMRDSAMNLTETYATSTRFRQRVGGTNAGVSLNYTFDTMNSLDVWAGGWWRKPSSSDTAEVERTFYPAGNQLVYTDMISTSQSAPGMYAGAYYRHQFDDKGQALDLSYNLNYWGTDTKQEHTRTGEAGYQYFMDALYRGRYNGLSATYIKPFSENSELELGGELEHSHYTMGQDWKDDPVRTFLNDYYTTKGCLYGTYTHRFGPLTAKLGLRGEGHRILIDNADPTHNTLVRNYLNPIPSIHLTYCTEHNDQFKLNYTRRCGTPDDLQMLHDFRTYLLESVQDGNPDLRCSYTHNVEAGWSRFISKFGSLAMNLYYRGNTNNIRSFTDAVYDDFFARYVTCQRPLNVGNSHTLGGSAVVTYRPNAMVNVRLNASLYDNYYRAQFREGEWIESEMLCYSLCLSSWVKVWKVLDLFCNASYSSPTQQILATTGSRKSIDLGLSADLLDHKLTMTLAVSDLFNWNARDRNITNPYYTYRSTERVVSRYLYGGITWRLGKMELESHAKQSN